MKHIICYRTTHTGSPGSGFLWSLENSTISSSDMSRLRGRIVLTQYSYLKILWKVLSISFQTFWSNCIVSILYSSNQSRIACWGWIVEIDYDNDARQIPYLIEEISVWKAFLFSILQIHKSDTFCLIHYSNIWIHRIDGLSKVLAYKDCCSF